MDVKTIVLYVIIALILVWCIRSEWQDISCSGGENNVCGKGCGRAYYFARPQEGDKKRDLVSKLLKTASYDLTTVHWRRVMIIAILAPVVAFPLSEGCWPSPRTLAIAIIVGFLVGYALQIHFQTTVVRPALAQASQISKLL